MYSIISYAIISYCGIIEILMNKIDYFVYYYGYYTLIGMMKNEINCFMYYYYYQSIITLMINGHGMSYQFTDDRNTLCVT